VTSRCFIHCIQAKASFLWTLIILLAALAVPNTTLAAKSKTPKPKLELEELLVAESPPFSSDKPIVIVLRKITIPGYNEWKLRDGTEMTIPEAKEYLLNRLFREVCQDCTQVSVSSEDLLAAISLPEDVCSLAVGEPAICETLSSAGLLGAFKETSIFQNIPDQILTALRESGIQAILIDIDYSVVLTDTLTESSILAAQLASDLVPATTTFEARSLDNELLFKAETKRKAIWRDRTASTLMPILRDFSQWTCGQEW